MSQQSHSLYLFKWTDKLCPHKNLNSWPLNNTGLNYACSLKSQQQKPQNFIYNCSPQSSWYWIKSKWHIGRACCSLITQRARPHRLSGSSVGPGAGKHWRLPPCTWGGWVEHSVLANRRLGWSEGTCTEVRNSAGQGNFLGVLLFVKWMTEYKKINFNISIKK